MIPKTKSLTKAEAQADRKWHLIDVAGMTLGRAATQIAHLLRGKHKPTFTPNQDCGDFVIVINANKVTLTGNKLADKMYYRHTGFPGGIVGVPAKDLLRRKPQEVIERAVWGMLPKGPLGRRIHKKLKVYATAEHPHEAQQPAVYQIGSAR
jgi:large subunit ribosomal protein L13